MRCTHSAYQQDDLNQYFYNSLYEIVNIDEQVGRRDSAGYKENSKHQTSQLRRRFVLNGLAGEISLANYSGI